MTDTITTGDKILMGAGIQTSEGVAASSIIYSSTMPPSLNGRIEKQQVPANGHIADAKSVKNTKKYSEPSVSGPINNEFIGLLLKAAMGTHSPDTDTPEAGVTTHTFSVKNDNSHPKLTLDFDEGELKGRRILDAMLSRLQITVRNGEVAAFEADFFGGFPADETLSPAVPDEITYDPSHVTVKIVANEAALAAASGSCVEELTLTFEKNLGQHYCLGSLVPDKIYNTDMVVTGNLTTLYENQNYRDVWDGATFKAIGIYLENTDESIGNSTNPALSIVLPKVAYEEWTIDSPESDLVRQTIAFKAYLNGSDFVKAELVNETASY